APQANSGLAPSRPPRARAPMLCWADAGAGQRLLLVALAGRHVPGVPAPVLLPLLRRVGGMGAERAGGPPAPLRPEAAHRTSGVGGTRGARRGGAPAEGAPRRR